MGIGGGRGEKVERWEGGYGGKNHYIPKVVLIKCMKSVFLKRFL